ncbi:1-acyl-sn-glycerol-3-phosphate acyltransferases [Streptoalloteichus tenebrarius]|uniref:1-acyl-sn-glycerol-3-phosphate acyltransferases n=1 Tax=Streptoalloteichus tenebrarius (strain ATCC 17920 / DSM 40477 / JCM 4838 / CBS 697.72 / NBRC 16177 / NCIMB 11028 / NRRL B-12390 / A12253. 1 / ISP 5477) TaxID=1933 RepID=A0ABT1HN49_STRSD|nr:lysophospholipid acyltransferase family protein [Streptoalloteichus tenebrarius]MCP2256928.1 1-acyl-sn-glycerol-3-phosphate acyltransferases [Streptoalloteichus tenebrarius]
MVALPSLPNEPTRRLAPRRTRTPRLWRFLTRVDQALVALTGRLEVTGDVPAELRGRPLLMAANHIGVFDVFVLIAACRRIGVSPRFMATAGLFDTPVLGWALRRSGHVRVDRGKGNVTEAFDRAVAALRDGDPVLLYPEGRISRDPGLWPERGKSGVARMALAAHVPVVPVSQWGAHEAVYWGTLTVEGWSDVKPLLTSWLRALRARPTFRVHFGAPVDLTGLDASRPGDAVRARDRIMRAITAGLVPLRAKEPHQPDFHDPTRPTDGHSPWKP